MDLFYNSKYESDSFIDSAPPPQILGSSGPHGRRYTVSSANGPPEWEYCRFNTNQLDSSAKY